MVAARSPPGAAERLASARRFLYPKGASAQDPEKHVLDLSGDGYRFSEKIMRVWKK
jgi:hypothetical protein